MLRAKFYLERCFSRMTFKLDSGPPWGARQLRQLSCQVFKNRTPCIKIIFTAKHLFQPFFQWILIVYFSNWIFVLNTVMLKINFQFCYECPTSIYNSNWALLFWWAEPNDLQNLFALLRRQIASSKPDQITLRKPSFIQSYIPPSAIKTQMSILHAIAL